MQDSCKIIQCGFAPTYQHHTASVETFQSGDQQIHVGTLIAHMVPKLELQELEEPSQWMLNKKINVNNLAQNSSSSY